MEDIRSIHLKRLQGQLGEIAYELTKVSFSRFAHPTAWKPAINAYRCDRQIIICVDLAGVSKSMLDLRIEGNRLRISGRREPPEPAQSEHAPLQVLAMEIDYGAFEREVAVPAEVDPGLVRAEQREGLLWVFLPFRAHS